MKIGFIGLGNVGGKLATSLVRSGHHLMVLDLNPDASQVLLDLGASPAASPKEIAQNCETIITCLPSPSASADVMEAEDGILSFLSPGTLWMEMSTTDEAEVKRISRLVANKSGSSLDCPVSGGCHRAATGNISIFVGGARVDFDRAFPLLQSMGRNILHTGSLGSASILKVVTNYLASVNLIALGEALMTTHCAGIDLGVAYDAIRISSGNSFVHETESQLILNGSRNINFTLDLVVKDMGLFEAVAEKSGVPLEIAPILSNIFKDGALRYGGREWSSNIVRRLEDACGVKLRASGFPSEIIDSEDEMIGVEISGSRD
ncbi:MAG: 3-hydroxyisobutyrate dehydrogenase [Acidiferrobacteraceae bacterium]|nr:3-hydroxyisobutyrate dehydrogenase [Acidiferrobacteraceae bacterium]